MARFQRPCGGAVFRVGGDVGAFDGVGAGAQGFFVGAVVVGFVVGGEGGAVVGVVVGAVGGGVACESPVHGVFLGAELHV